MNGMEVLEIKEVENKPTNVEEAIKAGWKTAKEMYEVAGVDRRTWENFVADVRNAISKKPNSSCENVFTTRIWFFRYSISNICYKIFPGSSIHTCYFIHFLCCLPTCFNCFFYVSWFVFNFFNL